MYNLKISFFPVKFKVISKVVTPLPIVLEDDPITPLLASRLKSTELILEGQ